MGVDLKLLVVDGQLSNGGYSHTMLEFGRYYDLFKKLNQKARTIPGFTLSSYVATIPDGSMKDEHCYGFVAKTPYGEPLTYVSAKEFVDCAVFFKLDSFARAAVAYLENVPPDTLVGLFYH